MLYRLRFELLLVLVLELVTRPLAITIHLDPLVVKIDSSTFDHLRADPHFRRRLVGEVRSRLVVYLKCEAVGFEVEANSELPSKFIVDQRYRVY